MIVEDNLTVGDTVVETTPSGREHTYTVTAVDVTPKNPAALGGRYVVISRDHVHHTMRQEDIFNVAWMEVVFADIDAAELEEARKDPSVKALADAASRHLDKLRKTRRIR